MKKIKLPQNKYALVDDADFEWLNKLKWSLSKGYAVNNQRNMKFKKGTGMHRLILKTPVGKITDHIDRNPLNNQRKNLRVCTVSQNAMNQSKQKNNTSGYKGVSKASGYRGFKIYKGLRKKWQVNIMVNKKSIFLGLFTNKEKAHEAYKNACVKYHKNFARIK